MRAHSVSGLHNSNNLFHATRLPSNEQQKNCMQRPARDFKEIRDIEK